MTIEEMQRRVLLKINEVGAFVNEDILPEEVDIFINDAIDEFVKQRFNPFGNKYRKGFEDSPKRIEDLRTLVETSGYLSVRKGSFQFGSFQTDVIQLPNDFMLPISLNAKVEEGDSIVDRPHSFETHSVSVVDSTTVNVDTGDPNDSQYFEDGDTVYIGSINDITLATKFIVSSSTDTGSGNFDVTLNSEHGLSSDGYIFYNLSETKRYIEGNVTNSREVYAKWVQHEDLYRLFDDPFNKPSARKPLYTISDNLIHLYATDSFIIDEINLHYIRQPATVDSQATDPVDCDLPETVHSEIVDQTASKILANTGEFGPQYQSQQLTNNE